MRWKLKTTLVILAIICVLLARFGYIHNQYPNLRAAGVQQFFDWQNPAIAKTTVMFSKQIENQSIPITVTTREYYLTPRQRTWADRLTNTFVSKEPVALQIDARTLSRELIQTIKSMPCLNEILLTHAGNATAPVDPKIDEILQKLNHELPDVRIRLGAQYVPSNKAGG